jgi:hypothetical protein
MSALVVIDFEMYIQPGNCLDDCTIAVAQPYYVDMGCTFSLEGLKDVSRLILSPYLLFCALALRMSLHLSVPHPIQQKKNVECVDCSGLGRRNLLFGRVPCCV